MKNPDFYTGRMGNRLFQIAYLYSQAKEGKIPDWYVQDYRHFEKYEKELKELFKDDIGYLPYVAIHLRVGGNPANPGEPNYIDNPFYTPLCKTGYYIDAINKFPNRKFLVFSDNMEFAKTYFEGDKFAFDDSPTDLEAFNRMASCDSQIIANSSYSYWAAYLNPNPAKIIIAPTVDKWYSDKIERTICPDSWIRV